MTSSSSPKSSLSVIFSSLYYLTLVAVNSQSTDAGYNNVNSQYFVGIFFSYEFPYAIGKCQGINPFNQNSFGMATCVSETEVSWSQYSDNSCSNDSLTSSTLYDASIFQTGQGTLFDFNCDDDAVIAYGHFELGIGCSSNTMVELYGALSVCTYQTSFIRTMNLYCKDDYGEAQYYQNNENNCINTSDITQIDQSIDTCGYVTTVNGNDFYGSILDCVLDESNNNNEFVAIANNDVVSQYFVSTVNNEAFPMAIDKCQARDIAGSNEYQKAVCVDESQAVLEVYLDDECSGSQVSSQSFNSSYQTGNGNLYDFNCDNTATDSYVTVQMGIFTSCTNLRTFYVAVNVCTRVVASDTMLNVYCEQTDDTSYSSSFRYFSGDSDCSNENDLIANYDSSQECTFLREVSGISIYSQTVGCLGSTLSTDSPTTVMLPTEEPPSTLMPTSEPAVVAGGETTTMTTTSTSTTSTPTSVTTVTTTVSTTVTLIDSACEV